MTKKVTLDKTEYDQMEKEIEPNSLIIPKVYRGGVNHEKEHSLINVTRLVIMFIGFTIGFSLGILI